MPLWQTPIGLVATAWGGLSLGGERRFQFRHRKTKQTITLKLRMGHWFIVTGDTQRFWLHQVPKTAAAVAPRLNLTFRHMILSRPWWKLASVSVSERRSRPTYFFQMKSMASAGLSGRKILTSNGSSMRRSELLRLGCD